MEVKCYVESPVGFWIIKRDDEGISRIDLRPHYAAQAKKQGPVGDPLLKEAVKELREYFDGRRKIFDLPLSLKGTEFQQRVWEELRKIGYGETRSYGEIAKALGKPGAARAVGMANNRNPVSILIPCHRVVGSDGSLVGYGGGLKAKEYLLRLEGAALKK